MAKKKKKLNVYAQFVKAHRGQGLTMKQLGRLWRKTKKSAKGKKGKRSSRALPKELLDLAAALRAASAGEPGAPKASALERKMESLIRQIRKAQKSAADSARAAREAEEIREQAKAWAERGPSAGDPSLARRWTVNFVVDGHKRQVSFGSKDKALAYARRLHGRHGLGPHSLWIDMSIGTARPASGRRRRKR